MLDIDQLREMGCLRPGWSGACQWTDGNEVVSINLRTEVKRLHLSYTVRVGMGNGKTWSRPSRSSSCAVGSAALAPFSSALDLETALIVDDA